MALNNTQYQKLMREYEHRKQRNRGLQKERYEEIRKSIPELSTLDQRIVTISIQSARLRVLDLEDTAPSFNTELQKLAAMRISLLTSHGYPPDYLDPIYDCSDCHDTGYVQNKKCHCFQRAVVDLLYTQSNLSELLDAESFDAFSLEYYSHNFMDPNSNHSALEIAEMTLKTCHLFVEQFSSEFQNLFISGNPGLGKTFLSHCIAQELIRNSYSVIYFTSSEFFELCAKHTFRQNTITELMEGHLAACDLLILDDLGTELQNSFTNSQLFACLNERILHKKSTLISTNLSIHELKSMYGERIFSRISSSYTMIRLIGDDIRIQKKLMK